MNLFLIDAIGPFFRQYKKKKINWSKIPFEHLQTSGKGRIQQFSEIRRDLNEFATRVAYVGYNAVTLDDVTHLTDHPFLEEHIREKIKVLGQEFKTLFADIRSHGLAVFVTMDVYSSTPSLKKALDECPKKIEQYLCDQIDSFLVLYPEVSGIIVRIGESDGLDVIDDFRSELYIKSDKELNRFLKAILPIFEKHKRYLVLRTWTVGAYQIGDLIWHRDTLSRALAGIDSNNFILSMKHGESDFFRYLPLNRSFFRHRCKKIIELQTKREYEGCGEFPAFIGLDHEHFARELASADNVVGVSVWCQTGGWVPFRRLAYIGEGSPWTEINSDVTLRIFRYGESLEQAVEFIANTGQHLKLLEFLRLSEDVIRELYYHEEFAQQKLFFRRVRIPPLIGVYWHTIFINHSLRKLLKHYVSDPETSIRTGNIALGKIDRMEALATELNLPVDDVRYMRCTLGILALARQYYYRPFEPEICEKLKRAKKRYKKTYPKGTRHRYNIRINFKRFRVKRRFIGWSLAVLLRHKRGYRIIDQLFTIHLLAGIYRLINRSDSKIIPKFAQKSAMGIDTIFK